MVGDTILKRDRIIWQPDLSGRWLFVANLTF
jgi:hypothetical protein